MFAFHLNSQSILIISLLQLISRLPDGCFPSEISRFLSEQARELDPEVFPAVIDTYMCTPFPQFCFAALGGRSIGSKLAQFVFTFIFCIIFSQKTDSKKGHENAIYL